MTRNLLNPLVADFLTKTSQHMFNAAQSGDADYAEATMRKTRELLDLYIGALEEGKKHGNTAS